MGFFDRSVRDRLRAPFVFFPLFYLRPVSSCLSFVVFFLLFLSLSLFSLLSLSLSLSFSFLSFLSLLCLLLALAPQRQPCISETLSTELTQHGIIRLGTLLDTQEDLVVRRT